MTRLAAVALTLATTPSSSPTSWAEGLLQDPYNGRVYGTEIARGFDVMNLSGAFDNGSTKLSYLNVQTQQPLSR